MTQYRYIDEFVYCRVLPVNDIFKRFYSSDTQKN